MDGERVLMEFRIADTFTDSPARLTAQEQKAVKTTAFDLQLNSAAPGMNFHKIDRARDPNLWSVRVNADPPDRAQLGGQSAARPCRSSRRRLQMGRAAQDRAPPDDGGDAAR
jgi:hypothetical protein